MKKFLYGFLIGSVLVFSLATASGAATPVKWSYATGGVVGSSPAIATDGTIYVGSSDLSLYAINPDGTLKWSYATGGAITSTPAIGADGTVYVGSYLTLYAINPDGTLKWSYAPGGAISSSPAIGADGTVYVGMDYKLIAVSSKGKLKWTVRTSAGMIPVLVYFSSPVIGPDGTIYAGASTGKLYAVNRNGAVKWICLPSGSMVASSEISSPAIGADGTIYAGFRKALYAVNSKGKVKWSYAAGTGDTPSTSSPAIGADGTIYLVSSDHSLYAVNADGTLKWSYATGGSSGITRSTPAIGADGAVYVGSYDHSLYAINADGALKWSYATGDVIASSPAIAADGTVYVGSNDHSLYAFSGTSSGLADSAWPMFRGDLRRTGQAPLPVLTVAKSGTGSGTVTSAPSGIDCGPTCSAAYLKGTVITLAADPGTNAVFSGWSGECSGKRVCRVALSGDKSVGAAFDIATCTFAVSPARRSFSYKGGNVTVRVSARGADTCGDPAITASDSWFTATLVSFAHNRGTVSITVSENTSTAARNGFATIGGQAFTITQAGTP